MNEHDQAYKQLVDLLNEDSQYLAAYYMAGKSAEAIQKNKEAIHWYSTGIDVAKLQKNPHTLNELLAALNQLEEGE